MNNVLEKIHTVVIVSVQAMPNEPLYAEQCMIAMMKSVINGGAGALRVAGIRDIQNAKKLFSVPIIGITKPEIIPINYKELVYITPTYQDIVSVTNSGADIVAFDGTVRPRPDGEKLENSIRYIHMNKKLAMADVATVEDGIASKKAGADILSTTLAGYTLESANSPSDEPDFELLEKLINETGLPVILEGRIWHPEQVNKAFELGAHSVVIGSAITRPQLITKKFVFRG
jgi:N-acylglucosamine-6-phosphate 2-epimerase